MRELLCTLLLVYLVVLIARILLSWFPIQSGTPLASIQRVLMDVTEPVLGPLRRVIPPLGMFDLSPIVVFLGIGILRTALGCG